MMRTLRASSITVCIAACATTVIADPPPKRGYVPTEAVAIAIAEAILAPIHGAEDVAKQRPFTAELQNGAWFVYGTGPQPYKTGSTIHVTMGGQMFIRVDKYTGAIVETGWLK
jgi:hypothetical protein